jgi:protein-L-isoaspartate(D-aspartate) O-methyltransferase
MELNRRLALCALLTMRGALPAASDDPAREREQMVTEQVESRGIRRADLLRVMRATPRHLFVPEGVRSLAHRDLPVSIGHGATISQPYVVALMTELLEPQKRHRVLEIGTGSGYQAAILGELAAEVYTIELVPELAASSASTLRELKHDNVFVRQGDGYRGWPERAPFDRIILTAAPPEIPGALIAQLAREGRLVAPVETNAGQELVVIDKDARGNVKRRSAGPVLFVPMRQGGK